MARGLRPRGRRLGMGMFNRLVTPVGTEVLLVSGDEERARAMEAMLIEQGFGLAGVIADPANIAAEVAQSRVQVIIVNADKVDPPLIAALGKIPAEARRPTVLFCEDASTEGIHAAVAAGVNAYVVGLGGNRIRAAIDMAEANYRNIRQLRDELEEAREALKARKVIERAKGLIMKEKGLDEAAAYQLLRSRAMQKGQRLVDVATTITEAAEVMK